ncbi:hypothetical protein BKA62DRAFT_766516 [Auriculariales sp. MPI-PUGE-AT-0066]|nr:hypothetical protein BKA62DRAFT_766516 [Auriculariales sp. MPI-PUGE-AT-0066]
MNTKTAIVALALGATASAFSLSSLSQSCQATISRVTAEPCIASSQFTNIFLVKSDDSIIKATDSWLKTFCGTATDCSSDVIAKSANDIQVGCADDISPYGITADHFDLVLPYVQKYWQTAKEVACLADTSVNQYCVPSVASNIEKTLNTDVSVNWIRNEIVDSLAAGQFSLPKSVVCNSCTQVALSKVLPTELTDVVDLAGYASGVCGKEFVDTAVHQPPQNIIEGIGKDALQTETPGGAATMLSVAGTLLAAVGFAAAHLL